MKALDRDLRERIDRAGDGLLPGLPPYSPDLNPIEKVFSKAKEFLRSAAFRTEAALYDAIAFALETVAARDCRNVLRSCGYWATSYVKTL